MPTLPTLALLLPLYVLALWILVTTATGAMSGWYALRRRFPDRPEAPQKTLRGVSGMMGSRVMMRGVLAVSACPSGLRIAITRAFGPFCRPVFIPWSEIGAAPATVLFTPMMRLSLGRDARETLWLYPSTFARLAAAAPTLPEARLGPDPTNADVVRGLALQWAFAIAVTTLSVALMFRLAIPDGETLSLAMCLAVSVIAFTVAFAATVALHRRRR